MRYRISAITTNGMYEFITEGEKDFPQKAAEGFAAGGVSFTTEDGEFVILSSANLIGLSIKNIEEGEEENPPRG